MIATTNTAHKAAMSGLARSHVSAMACHEGSVTEGAGEEAASDIGTEGGGNAEDARDKLSKPKIKERFLQRVFRGGGSLGQPPDEKQFGYQDQGKLFRDEEEKRGSG